jgi:hemerythrin superfamily protein
MAEQAQIYRDLKADHDKQRGMLKELGDLRGDTKKRQKLFEEFRLELQSHAAAEEESLYATMLGKPDLRDDARHSVSEHKEVDDLLGEMIDLDFGGDEWEEKFHLMRHRYLHHIEEEEEEMFPAAAKELDAETEAQLAEVYEERKPEERELAKDNPPGSDERE